MSANDARPIPVVDLAGALGLSPSERHQVAVVGGGGKTTVAHALADQLWIADERPTLVTTTTKMGVDQHRGKPLLVSPPESELRMMLREGPVMVVSRVEDQKVVGVAPEVCDRWFTAGVADRILVEADGSRRRPFKAPREHEPVVPSSTTTMVSVIGADALGRVIADQCHRPLRVAALAECSPYVRLTPESAARVLLHERGARKANPPGSRLAVVVNKVTEATLEASRAVAASVARAEPSVPVVLVEWEPSFGSDRG